MQLSINAPTARVLLRDRQLSVSHLRRQGRIEIVPNVFITLVGRCRYTLLDLSSASGEGIADLIPAHDRHLVPAWQEDQDGTREERQAKGQLDSLRHRLLHG